MTRMKAYYKETVAPALFKKFGYKSTMQVPKLDKIIINVGCGEAKENAKVVDAIMSDLMQITGPVSYTHLDVYKRQPITFGTGNPKQYRCRWSSRETDQ